VAVVLGLGLYADFGSLGEELASFRWELFPLALALTALNYLLRFWRWERYLAKLAIAIPRGRSLTIFVAGLTMTITPAKLGELLKSGLLKRDYEVPVRRSGPVVLAERVTDATGVVVLAVVAGASGRNWPLLAAAALAVVGVVLVVRSPLLERFARLVEARGAARTLLGTRLLVEMTLLSAVSWLFECLAAYVCVKGLRLDLSLADTIVVFTLGSLAGALSFLPGGLGVAETSMTALIKALGDTTKAQAAAATVLIRLATLWFAVVLGLVGLAVEERLYRRAQVGRTGKARTS
jgi:uncharacterized membrane protein YbhN (UPF0104 family)